MMLYLKEAWRSLYATKQRTFLALVGIVIGIGSVISVVSIGEIVAAEAVRAFRSLGTDVLLINLYSEDPANSGLRSTRLVSGLTKHTGCVERAAPFITRYIELLQPKDRPEIEDLDAETVAVSADFLDVGRLSVRAGRFVSDLDADSPFVVLGADVPALLGLDPSADGLVGREVIIEDKTLRIAGVLFSAPSMNFLVSEPNRAMYLPIGIPLSSDSRSQINDVVARMKPGSSPETCVMEIEHYFKRRSDGLTVEVETAKELIASMRKQADLLAALLAGVGSISLVVGGIGIMNMMLVSVTERKQEIGIRRALGAKRRDIRYQFLTESLMLSMLGGILGILVSAIVTNVVCDLNDWEFFVSPGPVALGAGISTVIGVLFGFLPAYQASNLDPIDSLRAG